MSGVFNRFNITVLIGKEGETANVKLRLPQGTAEDLTIIQNFEKLWKENSKANEESDNLCVEIKLHSAWFEEKKEISTEAEPKAMQEVRENPEGKRNDSRMRATRKQDEKPEKRERRPRKKKTTEPEENGNDDDASPEISKEPNTQDNTIEADTEQTVESESHSVNVEEEVERPEPEKIEENSSTVEENSEKQPDSSKENSRNSDKQITITSDTNKESAPALFVEDSSNSDETVVNINDVSTASSAEINKLWKQLKKTNCSKTDIWNFAMTVLPKVQGVDPIVVKAARALLSASCSIVLLDPRITDADATLERVTYITNLDFNTLSMMFSPENLTYEFADAMSAFELYKSLPVNAQNGGKEMLSNLLKHFML